MDELKPCPFCGSRDVAPTGRCIECYRCHSTGPEREFRGDAIAAWNRRTPEGE